jgi:hypothetical protein
MYKTKKLRRINANMKEFIHLKIKPTNQSTPQVRKTEPKPPC